MNESDRPTPPALTWSTGLAVIVFCLTGVASMLGWIPPAQNDADLQAVAEKAVAPGGTLAQADCPSCGVIAATCVLDRPDDEGFMAGLVNASGVLGPGLVAAVSGENREAADRKDGRYHQATVRFGNGTVRVFADRSEPRLQVGERVRVTEGVILRIADTVAERQHKAS